MQQVGKKIENLASAYLQKHNLKLVTTNYSCKMGEIDLIMMDKEILVFIEVRYRRDRNYGDAVGSINKSKQNKIKKTASYYLQQHKLYDKISCRFDVVAVSGQSSEDLYWIKDAFWGCW